MDMETVAGFTGEGALAWEDRHPCLFTATDRFFRTGYRAHLPGEWIPSLDGVEDKLRAGARVADVGCGHGAFVVAMAKAYSRSRFWGFDYHPPSIETARERAREAHISDRATFEVAGAKDYLGSYDLICVFDCLHDIGDPAAIAAHAREHLVADGTVMLIEPLALDGRTDNLPCNPMAALLYPATATCTPSSLSQQVGFGLGGHAGEARLRAVFEEAGTPLSLILEARCK
jgi:SAM-dependent methyltransferase